MHAEGYCRKVSLARTVCHTLTAFLVLPSDSRGNNGSMLLSENFSSRSSCTSSSWLLIVLRVNAMVILFRGVAVTVSPCLVDQGVALWRETRSERMYYDGCHLLALVETRSCCQLNRCEVTARRGRVDGFRKGL
jgi:hypothetical protein